MCSSTTAERQSLASRDRTCCLRRCLPARPLRYYGFRGSIAHPTQSLCTLRTRRRRRPRNTRYRAPATAYPDRSLTGRTTPAYLAHKQSIKPQREKVWIASRSLSSGAHSRDPLARNDVGFQNATPRSRGALRPSCAFIFRPLEGVGNAGCPLHPRFRVHLVVVECTRATTSTPESPGIPARNGFNGLCRALPGDRALLPPSSADRFCLSPVGPTQLRELDASVGASGPHDFAVRCNISRPLARRSLTGLIDPPCNSVARKTLPRPPHPHPASVTIAIRPSGGVGWREFVEMICPTGEVKYFCKWDWTAFLQVSPSGKSLRAHGEAGGGGDERGRKG